MNKDEMDVHEFRKYYMEAQMSEGQEIDQLKKDYDELLSVRNTLEAEIESQAEKIAELQSKIRDAKELFDSITSLCTDILRQMR